VSAQITKSNNLKLSLIGGKNWPKLALLGPDANGSYRGRTEIDGAPFLSFNFENW
jgi:hypothetical protein